MYNEMINFSFITLTQDNLDPDLLPSSWVQLPLMELPEKGSIFHNTKISSGLSWR